jgi:hypothetical protein
MEQPTEVAQHGKVAEVLDPAGEIEAIAHEV